jgi:hypothetical protein
MQKHQGKAADYVFSGQDFEKKLTIHLPGHLIGCWWPIPKNAKA